MKPSPVPADARIGICLCTYGSIPYIHLGLEALKRNEPDVPVLVHDDSSADQLKLKLLAEEYGADFVSTDMRKVPTVGDLSGFVEALRWGQMRGLDIAVKCSRRFVIYKPFAAGLRELMHNMQYATACAPCGHYLFGFRSEVVAMHVGSWHAAGAFAQMQEAVRINQRYDSLPEAWTHHRARDVHRFVHPVAEEASHAGNVLEDGCDYLVRSERAFNRPDSYAAFAWWPLMGLSRHCRVPGVLWHDSHQPEDYAALAKEYELPYKKEDFVVIPGN